VRFKSGNNLSNPRSKIATRVFKIGNDTKKLLKKAGFSDIINPMMTSKKKG